MLFDIEPPLVALISLIEPPTNNKLLFILALVNILEDIIPSSSVL